MKLLFYLNLFLVCSYVLSQECDNNSTIKQEFYLDLYTYNTRQEAFLKMLEEKFKIPRDNLIELLSDEEKSIQLVIKSLEHENFENHQLVFVFISKMLYCNFYKDRNQRVLMNILINRKLIFAALNTLPYFKPDILVEHFGLFIGYLNKVDAFSEKGLKNLIVLVCLHKPEKILDILNYIEDEAAYNIRYQLIDTLLLLLDYSDKLNINLIKNTDKIAITVLNYLKKEKEDKIKKHLIDIFAKLKKKESFISEFSNFLKEENSSLITKEILEVINTTNKFDTSIMSNLEFIIIYDKNIEIKKIALSILIKNDDYLGISIPIMLKALKTEISENIKKLILDKKKKVIPFLKAELEKTTDQEMKLEIISIIENINIQSDTEK